MCCNSKAYIRDYQSLIDLNNTLEYGADSILKILESVNNYLQGVKEALSKQLKALEEELCIAEEELAEAEKAHSSCVASQRWVEEYEDEDGNTHGGYYTPSCDSEASEVERCQIERDRCQERYDKGKRICDECEYEIAKYKETGGFVIPPGGEKTLEYIAKDHTDKATSKMREILAVVEEYLRCNMSIKAYNTSSTVITPNLNGLEPDKPLSPIQKKERFINAVQRVIQRQQDENCGSNKIAEANKVIVCPVCGRPIVACICSNARDGEYTREQINIINSNSLSQ